MRKKRITISWIASFIALLSISEFYFAPTYNNWKFMPSVLWIWPLLLLGLFCAIRIPKEGRGFYKYVSILIPSLLAITLMLPTLQALVSGKEKVMTTTSPDGSYTVDIYQRDNPKVLMAERNGPLWFRQELHVDRNPDGVIVQWITSSQLQINQSIVDIKKTGEQ
ncbi:hypothetical protein DES38_101278 [Streptohalobacillus salinus]|uniref:Uncharacterized protein n=2 Tax=Streptohalobacillus salinus TaxID=621096 RepID=A0A2V3WVS4_9BACI|nr:hypothetical protein DES38_101278 [Streptohalobacillus salinus]